MLDFVVCLGLVVLGLVGVLAQGRRHNAWERRMLLIGYMLHVAGAVAMVLLTVYFFGGGDLTQYHMLGGEYAEQVKRDPTEGALELLWYTFRGSSDQFFLAETSTGSMFGLSAMTSLLLGGGLYSMCMFWGILCFVSQWFLYLAMREELPSRYHKVMMVAFFMIPSYVFWTSALLKEPVAMAGLGPIIWGVSRLIHGRWSIRAGVAMVVGGLLTGLVKPYILFVLALSCGVWFYWWRSLSVTGSIGVLKRPVYIVLAVLAVVGAVVGMGVLFPEYSINTLPEQIVQRQYNGSLVEGGSNYSFGTTSAPTEGASSGRLLLLAPLALLYSLFRPLPFEVSNAAVLLNVVEMLMIMALWVRLLTVRPWRQTLRMITMSPALMFCVSFVLIFGTIVGLSTTNVGTLSRYRVPMMPMYVLLLLILGQRLPVQLRAQLAQERKRS